ncbi:MAG: HIT family protein [Sulfobacillus benefaciens]|uniref:HIT family protein n=1 Tax=Sulfobacillus benefaciens TaxID=453960 RepID=A0A2T2XGU0_9FIRM|nr:MAG: HIT family protein [Sulfobacillus benefaciens]
MPSLFSRIVQKELPSYGILEDEQFYAFLDIRPVKDGHTLVVPKVEVDQFFDLDPAHLSAILQFAKPIADALKIVTHCDRVGLVVAGFEVPHAHLHLIPANEMEDLDFGRAHLAPEAALRDMAQRLREVLS